MNKKLELNYCIWIFKCSTLIIKFNITVGDFKYPLLRYMKYKLQRCTLSQLIEGKNVMVCPFLIYFKFYMRKDIPSQKYLLINDNGLPFVTSTVNAKGGPFEKLT